MNRTIQWKRQWGGNDRVVWIDVAKFNEGWRPERGWYLGPRRARLAPKCQKFGAWLAAQPASVRVNMPHVSLYENGTVGFTDGTHRFAWCRDHGVRAMPVSVATRAEADEFRRRFGSRARRCVLKAA